MSNHPDLYPYQVPKLTLLQTDVMETELLFRKMSLDELSKMNAHPEMDNRYVFYRLKYEKPEDDFTGLRKLILAIRHKTGMPILSDGHTVTINLENEMTLIYGEPGSKKSRVLISVLLAILALAGESMIIPDIKGELSTGILAPKIMGILKKKGYNIRVINFRTLDGDGFDLLGNAFEEYKKGNREEAMVQLHNIIDALGN